MSCSISMSPATSGSILTAVTFFLPSMCTVTIPPPAEASTRMSAISSCIFFCICSAFCIMACMFPGSFICPALLFQIADHADLRVGEQFLEAADLGVGEGALGDVVGFFGERNSGRVRFAERDFDAHRPAGNFLHDLQNIFFVHGERELFGGGKEQLAV